MKPRPRHAPALFSSLPAFTDAIGQPQAPTVAFTFRGQGPIAVSSNRKIHDQPARLHGTTLRPAYATTACNHDSSFRFKLSPKWSSALSAASGKELFGVARNVLAGIALEGALESIHPGLRRVLRHREFGFLEIPMMEFLAPNDRRRRLSTRTLSALALYFESRYDCRDGVSRWVGWNVFSRPHEERLDCIARDITQAKSAADAAQGMQQLFTASGDLFCILDSRGRFQLVNPAFEKVLGFEPRRLMRTAFTGIVSRSDRRKAATRLGAATLEQEVLFVAHCGTERRRKRIAWKAVAAPPHGSVYCVGRDVTDLRVLEEMRAGSDRLFVNVAQLSNDVNNPLEAMWNLLFLLRQRGLAEKDHWRYLDLAEEQVSRIAAAIRRIV